MSEVFEYYDVSHMRKLKRGYFIERVGNANKILFDLADRNHNNMISDLEWGDFSSQLR